jgi:hypothetical protein
MQSFGAGSIVPEERKSYSAGREKIPVIRLLCPPTLRQKKVESTYSRENSRFHAILVESELV